MGARPDALTSAALKAAIDHAWHVFDVPAPKTIGVCDACCMDPALAADMLATPAKTLTALQLREWFYAAYDVSISHDHVAWVLPRLFELLVDGWHFDYLGPEILLHRLVLTGFPTQWPEAEVAAVHRLCEALWSRQLIAPDARVRSTIHDPDIDQWLCMFAIGELDIQPFLDRLWALPDEQLVDLLHHDWIAAWKSGFISFSSYWSNAPEAARQRAWAFYTAPALAERLMACAPAGDDRALALAALVEASAGSDPPH